MPTPAPNDFEPTESRGIDTRYGRFRVQRFRSASSGEPALALLRGDVGGAEPLLVRVHSSCLTSEFLGALDCDCAEQLAGALAAIAHAGRGVLLYLMQEGRGAGLLAKARDRMMVQAHGERITTFEAYDRMGLPRDRRSYEAVPPLLAQLGIHAPLRLLTHNPEKALAARGRRRARARDARAAARPLARGTPTTSRRRPARGTRWRSMPPAAPRCPSRWRGSSRTRSRSCPASCARPAT